MGDMPFSLSSSLVLISRLLLLRVSVEELSHLTLQIHLNLKVYFIITRYIAPGWPV